MSAMFEKLSFLVLLLSFASICHLVNSSVCPQKCTCTDNLKIVNCENRRLGKIPDNIPVEVTSLYLGKNAITEITSRNLRNLTNLVELSLITNRIQTVDRDAFVDLGKLKELYLRNNLLAKLPDQLFRGTGSLQDMYLTDNKLTSIPDLVGAVNLIRLSLDTNKINSAFFPESFRNLTKLSTINLANNALLEKITDANFQYLNKSSVRSLNLGGCIHLKQIDARIFTFFKHLQSLSLQYNSELSVTTMKEIFAALASTNASELASLTLSNIFTGTLDVDTFKDLLGVPIKTLYLDHTDVAMISAGTFDYFPHLQYLSMQNGALSYVQNGTFTEKLSNLVRLALNGNHMSTCPQISASGLKELDLSNNILLELRPDTFIKLENLEKLRLRKCGISRIFSNSMNGLSSLNSLDLSSNNFGGTSLPDQFFQPVPLLTKLNLSGNKLTTMATSYNFFTWLQNLEELDLSNNGCGNISVKIFQPLKSLIYLSLDNNMLQHVFSSDTEGELFRGLTNLQQISVAENKLSFVHQTLLIDQRNLTKLDLHNNGMSAWPKNFLSDEVLNKTTLIDLSSNQIAFVTESELSTLPSNVKLNLSGNPFSCGCDLIWFRRWISTHNDSSTRLIDLHKKYICNSPEDLMGKPIEYFNPDSIERFCHPPPWMWILIVVGSAAAVISLIFGTLIYRNRWPLKLRLYKLKQRWGSHREDGYGRVENERQYEIMLSHGPSPLVRSWVTEFLLPEIDISNQVLNEEESDDDSEREDLPEVERLQRQPEGANPQKWKTFFYDRDIPPNASPIGTIADAIYLSKKIILVLTKDYLKDARSKYEMDLAVTACIAQRVGLDAIILVQLDPGVAVKLPKALHSLAAESERILEWYAMERETFFQLLKEQIRRPLQMAIVA